MWAQQEQCSPARIYSEWSQKFEEPWQSRLRDRRGVGQFCLQGRVKELAKSLLTRQGGDALNVRLALMVGAQVELN